MTGFERTPAQRAADLLPSPTVGVGASSESRAEQIGSFVIVVVFFPIASAGAAAMTLVWDPRAWWMVPLGLPVYAVLKFIFTRIRGGESGTVAVDEAGTVWVLRGRRAVRRLQRLFDGSIGDYRATFWLVMLGFTLGIIALMWFILSAAEQRGEQRQMEQLKPVLILFTTGGWAALDFVRGYARDFRVWRRGDLRLLNSAKMLPLLALYARYHGEEAALAGVPADRLAWTVEEHPEEHEVARRWGIAKTPRPTNL